MSLSQRPPSTQWATLKYRGGKFADVWFNPEGEAIAVTFRIPQEHFQIPGLGNDLTIENLLKAVAILPEEVESWRYGDVSHSGMDGSNPDFKTALPPPPPDVAHLDIHVRLKSLPQTVAPTPTLSTPEKAGVHTRDCGDQTCEPDALARAGGHALASASGSEKPEGEASFLRKQGEAEPEVSKAKWQDLEARWRAILGVEATMDTFRISMEGLLTEMEAAFRKPLTMEEKTYALRADVAQWERAKNRVHYALPKMKEFIHRAVWALGSPERKRLGELYKDHIQPQIHFPEMAEVLKQLDELQKDRQVLSALGKTVYQECRGISADIQGALRTLQNSANAQKTKAATSARGRFFK